MPGLSEDILRSLFFKVLRTPADWNQFGGIVEQMKAHATTNGVFRSALERHPNDNYYENQNFRPEDVWTIHRLVWELVVQGVLVPGHNAGNEKWPFLALTPYGQLVVASEETTPYDRDAYYSKALQVASQVSTLIAPYLKEAAEAFRRTLYLSSAVMLGVASEAALEAVGDEVAKAAGGNMPKKIREAAKLSRKHELIMGWIRSGVLEENRELENRVEAHLDLLLKAYMLTRNESGHPVGKMIAREVALAHLVTFPSYLETAAELLGFLKRP